MKQLRLGKDAFSAACKSLQAAGYLHMSKQSQAVNGTWGTVNYRLLDPFESAKSAPGRIIRPGGSMPVDNSWVEGGPTDENPRKQADLTVADYPSTVNPPLREKQVKENQSSSVLEIKSRAEIENDDVAASPSDDDLGIELFAGVVESEMDRLLSAVDAKLSFVELKRLIPEPLLSTLDIHRACTEILGRSMVVVRNPNAFVAKAIKDAPTEFFTGGGQTPPSEGFGASKPSWVCSRNGHKLDTSADARTCLFCDLVVEPADWKCGQHGHFRYMTSDVSCRECGYDMTNNSIHIHTAAQF
jgi:hypothetical protein